MPKTPPKSSDVRQWARQKGFEVGERGRLSPEVLAAYSAAHGGVKVAPAAKKSTAKKTAGRTPAKKAAAAKSETPAPVVAADSALIEALTSKVSALAARVERLEAARAAAPAKRGLFGRKG